MMTYKQAQCFFFFAVIFIISITFKPYPISWLVKLVPMMLLVFYASKSLTSTSGKIFIVGMVFSGVGDFFLDYDHVHWFIFGLGAFFIAHVCYLFALKPIKMQKIPFVGLYLVYGVGMFSVIAGGLGELFVPVLAYMSILLFMAVITLLSTKSNKWLIIGGLSFVVSDSLIGLDKFYYSISGAHYYIMASYYFAQFSLLKGFVLAGHEYK